MAFGPSGTELRQIRVLRDDDEAQDCRELRAEQQVACSASPTETESIQYSPGHCLHNAKFACVFFPCVLPLLLMCGELLLGVSVLCLLVIYLVDITSPTKKSTLLVFVMSVVVLQLMSVYCLIPLVWKSLFNLGLIFIYNAFLVLSGGVGLLQFKQLQHQEPQFVAQLEYVLFISYPITGQLTLTLVTCTTVGLWSAPYSCAVFGFLFLQIFHPSSRPSFIYYESVHKPGQEKPADRFILGPMEKTILLFNLLSVPGSLFIIINILEFLRIITWVKLAFCGFFPLFLSTCLDIREEMEFLEIRQKVVARVKWGSGLATLVLFCLILYSNGFLPLGMLPLVITSTTCALLVGMTAQKPWEKTHFYGACACLCVFYAFAFLTVVPFTLQYSFTLLGLPWWFVSVLLFLLSLLSVCCVLAACSKRQEWLNISLVVHSLVFVFCENILAADQLYHVFCLLSTGVATGYAVWRLQKSGKLDPFAGCLCVAIHGSKFPSCLALAPLNSPAEPSVVLPSALLTSPALLSFLFFIVATHLLWKKSEEKITTTQGFHLSLACCLAVLLVYDVLVAPMWLLFTHDTPSAADALATILFLWGALCVKLSYVHFGHNLTARRLNVLVFSTAVFVGVLQPELGVDRIFYSLPVYAVSLVIPLYSSEHALLAEGIALPWFLMVALVTVTAVSTKLISVQQCSSFHRRLLSAVVGVPVGLTVASQLLAASRPAIVGPLYGVSTAVVVYLLMESWVPSISELRAPLWPSYLTLVACFAIMAVLEAILLKTLDLAEPHTNSPVSPCVLYHAALHFLLVCTLKRDAITQDETLETKGKQELGRTLHSSSFFANISVAFAFFCALPCLPSHNLDWMMALSCLVFFLLRPEGMPFIEGKRLDLDPFLPTALALTFTMYGRTLSAIFPEEFTFWSSFVYFLEFVFLHISLPTHIIFIHGLWQQSIPLWEQQLTLGLAPSNVVLLVYCTTLPGRIFAVWGLASVYWTFYYVECPGNKLS